MICIGDITKIYGPVGTPPIPRSSAACCVGEVTDDQREVAELVRANLSKPANRGGETTEEETSLLVPL